MYILLTIGIGLVSFYMGFRAAYKYGFQQGIVAALETIILRVKGEDMSSADIAKMLQDKVDAI